MKPTNTLLSSNNNITPQQFLQAVTTYYNFIKEKQGLKTSNDKNTEVEEKLHAAIDQAFLTAKKFCIQNKKALFPKRRTMGTIYGIVGFRLGGPALVLPLNYTWQDYIPTLKQHLPKYLTSHLKPNIKLLIANRHTQEVAKFLSTHNIIIKQEDIFYIEVNTKHCST